MGEIAEAMLDGDMCEQCGDWLDDGDGFPRLCSSCGPHRRRRDRIHAEAIPRNLAPDYDRFAKDRRWLTAAASEGGVLGLHAPTFLAKLARRGLVYADTREVAGGPEAYFITNRGRAELIRIALHDAEDKREVAP